MSMSFSVITLTMAVKEILYKVTVLNSETYNKVKTDFWLGTDLRRSNVLSNGSYK